MRRTAALVLALASFAPAARAEAYCFATTCGSDGAICSPEAAPPCGTALRWARDCVGITTTEGGTAQLSPDDVRAAMRAAFGAWVGADCGGTTPGIGVIDMGDVTCGAVEYSSDAGNANILVFHDDAWPYPESPLHLGLTTVVFDTDTGEIYDADIEVNSTYPLSVGDPTSYDLRSILTHEAGHFLGLAHSGDTDATMYPQYFEGTTDFRSLAADDELAICEAYPPRVIDTTTCNPIPRHGFSELCAVDQRYATCSFSGRSGFTDGLTGWALVAVAAALWTLRAQTGGRGSPGHQRARARDPGPP